MAEAIEVHGGSRTEKGAAADAWGMKRFLGSVEKSLVDDRDYIQPGKKSGHAIREANVSALPCSCGTARLVVATPCGCYLFCFTALAMASFSLMLVMVRIF